MSLENEIRYELRCRGADFVYFADISRLSEEQNKRYPNALLIGITLSPDYIRKITDTPDYVQNMINNNQKNVDEFHVKEANTDRLADYIAGYLLLKGYSAYSQSEDNINSTGYYDEETKSTPLPHKTIAVLAGLGWIGKHNLLVTAEFGSAISMCTVLTDAPLKTVLYTPANPLCGNCTICRDICPARAIKGNIWSIKTSRDELVDINKCNTCLKCLAFCPWTQKYMKKNLQKKSIIK